MKRILLTFFMISLITLAGLSQIQVGEVAPDFTVTDVEGNSHTLSNYTAAGQYVMLDFFFTTCGPCQYYTPQISLAYETYGCNQGDLVVLGIDYGDSNAQVIAYDQTYGATYPSVSGNEGGGNAVVAAYGIIGFPFVCLISPAGIVTEIFETPTMQVFTYYFNLYGIEEMECITGNQDWFSNDDFSIYPNPASSFIRIDGPPGSQISIFSMDGTRITQFTLENEFYTLNVEGLKSGLYFVMCFSANRQTMLKFAVLD